MQIEYDFELDDGTRHSFVVDLQREERHPENAPAWTHLTQNQCPHCPHAGSHCPPAVDLQAVVDAFTEILSHHTAQITVRTPQRTVSAQANVQAGLASLFGLIMASSACPILKPMRGLARMHLPFQSLEESSFRMIGAYLLGELCRHREGGQADWSLASLREYFDDVLQLNATFRERIGEAAARDSTLNAVGTLATQALWVQMSLDEILEELKPLALVPPASAD